MELAFDGRTLGSLYVIPRILTALIPNKTLRVLELKDFRVPDDDKGLIAMPLSRLLTENHTFRRLSIVPYRYYYDADDNGGARRIDVTPIAKALATNPVKVIDLSRWCMDADGIQSLCEAVVDNKGTEVLILDEIEMDIEHVKAVCHLITLPSALKKLSLRDTGIGNDGLMLLVQALQQNTTNVMVKVDLQRNQGITNTSARAAIEYAKEHPSGVSFVLSATSVSRQVVRELSYYQELNMGPRRLLQANPRVSLWPHVFERVSNGRYRSHWNIKPKDLLFFFIKENVGLFRQGSSRRRNKRRRRTR